ncbi:MAG: hypothetical protein V4596_06360 [Bdellovibrionota bacterium]
MQYSRSLLMVLFYLLTLTPMAVIQASDLRIYGFADIVGSQSTSPYTLGAIGNTDRYITLDPESRLGLNLSSDLGGDEFRFAGQLLAKGNDEGSYELSADWIFVTYKYTDDFSIRVGRQINPIFLYSEQIDVGFTYLWVRLPAEVYETFPVKSFNGASLLYSTAIGDYRFQAQIFGGAGDVSIDQVNGKVYGAAQNTRGVEFLLSGDNMKFHITYIGTNADGTLTTYSTGPSGPPTVTLIDFGTFHVVSSGGSVDFEKFFFATEATRALVEGGGYVRSFTGAYASLGYHISPKLTPYLTFAWQGSLNGLAYMFPDPSVSTSTKKDQHSFMLGVNYKATPSLALKGEYMRTQQNYEDSLKSYGANTYTVAMDIIF